MSFASVLEVAARSGTAWRDVHLAAAAKGFSACGDFLIATTLVLTLQSAGFGGLAVAAVLLAAAVPKVLLAPLAGRVVDRVDSRRLLVAAGLGQAATATVLAQTSHPVAIVGLVSVLSAGLAVSTPTISALIPAMVQREDLPRAGAISQTASTIGMMSGPALAGFLLGQFTPMVPLLLSAVSYLVLVAAGILVHTRRGGIGSARRTTPDDMPTSAGAAAALPLPPAWALLRDPPLRAVVVSIAAVVAAVGAISVVHVFFVRETLGASETMYGLVEASEMAGLLLGAWLFARVARRVGGGDEALVRGVLLLLGAICATLPLVAVVGAVGWLIPLWIIAGSFNGGMNVFTGVVFATRVPAPVRGRAFATLGAVVQAAAVFGYFAGGILVDYLPTRPLVAGLGVAGLAVVAGLVPSVSRATRERSGGAGLATSRAAG